MNKPPVHAPPRPARSRRLSSFVGVLVGVLYVVTTTVVALRWLDVSEDDDRSMNHFFACRFVDMVDGRAYRPFVTRALVPGTIRVLRDNLPLRWQTATQGVVVRTFHLRQRMAGLGWEPERSFEYVVFGVITLAAFACVPFALRATFRSLFVAGPFWADALPLPLLLVLDPAFVRMHARFMYDPATLALAALGTWAAVARRTWLFYMIYVLAVMNKETAILLAALFLTVRVNECWGHAVPLLALWMGIRGGLAWVFRDNPGSAAWWIATRNLTRALGDAWGLAALTAALAVVAWGVWRWRSIRVVQLGVPVVVGVQLLAYLAVGVWGEYRIFYDVLPVAWVTVYAAVLLSCRAPIQARHAEEREQRPAA
jgi:hypothetical protein